MIDYCCYDSDNGPDGDGRAGWDDASGYQFCNTRTRLVR